jgi:2-dehydropantoate 2-reductase
MRIVVIGAGAMGGLFGGKLAAAGNDVLLYDTWSEHVAAIERLGLSIDGIDNTVVRYRVRATDQPPREIADAELILVQVKGYDTYQSLRIFNGHLNPETFVLSLQNGLGNLEQMRQALPGHHRILLGTTAHGATVLGPGRIQLSPRPRVSPSRRSAPSSSRPVSRPRSPPTSTPPSGPSSSPMSPSTH